MDNLEELNKKVDKLDMKLNAIYQILKSNNTNTFSTELGLNKTRTVKYNTFGQPVDLVKKNDIDFEELLSNVTKDKSTEIIVSIRDNKYPSVTKKQYDLIMSLKQLDTTN